MTSVKGTSRKLRSEFGFRGKLHLMLISTLTFVLSTFAAQNTVIVSPSGRDSNPGTERLPVATLEAARDRTRVIGSHKIVVHQGTYPFSAALALSEKDSGLTIEAAPHQHPIFSGGISFAPGLVHSCRDEAVLSRLADPSAKSKLMEVDLQQLGIKNLDPILPRGFPHGANPAPNEFYQGEKVLTLARWPNVGFAKVQKVTEPGNGEHDHDKPSRQPVFSIGERSKLWEKAEDPWMYGYWKYDWADESIPLKAINAQTGEVTLANPAVYGVDAGVPFFAENLLEELDMPGEYFLDRKSLHLYFIPWPSVGNPEPFVLSTLSKPLVSIEGATNVTLRALQFRYSRGDGVVVRKCEHVRLEGCSFSNLGARAAEIEDGHDSGLLSCEIRGTGEGGVRLAGGDRNRLDPARNFVENCEIENFERRSQTYRPAVSLDGVGNRVSHCYIHDAPHSAIIYGGNDHLIEFNRFSRTISLTGDGGVVYTGRDWTARGTVIRDNWFEDNVGQRKWEPAIYVDDLGSGIQMINNLIERCHWGFLIGGGRDNVLHGNIVVDCDLCFDCDARGLGWAASSKPTMMARLIAVPYQSNTWHSKYPGLTNILAEDPMAPQGNILTGNVLIRAGKVLQNMEAPFKKSAELHSNLEESTPTVDDLHRMQAIRKAAGIKPDTLTKSWDSNLHH